MDNTCKYLKNLSEDYFLGKIQYFCAKEECPLNKMFYSTFEGEPIKICLLKNESELEKKLNKTD